ncbi:MAG: globin [Ilumatobacteraceae bacterium]
MDDATLYDRVGGHAFFEQLVDSFYAGVATDDVLAPLYPEFPDFTGARHRLTLFLCQYWGGPTTYMDERGHPRLRMRHMPFHVGSLERDRWLDHMGAAIDATCTAADVPVDVASDIAAELTAYFRPAAEHLRNDTGLPITSSQFNLIPADDESAGERNA